MTDDFEPAGGMKIGPDGFQSPPTPLTYPKDPPRLCNAGPCRNYHTMTIRLDAQNNSDGSEVFHTEDHHYCYPGIGIESNLGSLPVLACNRWVPVRKLLRTSSSVKRAYDLELEKWKANHDFDLSDVSESPIEITICFQGGDGTGDGYMTIGVSVPLETPLREIPIAAGYPANSPLICEQYSAIEVDGDIIDNHNATLADLGVRKATITFHIPTLNFPESTK